MRRDKFNFNELKDAISEAKASNIIKTASAIDHENVVAAEALETLCGIGDELDNMGREELADSLEKAIKAVLLSKIKVAEDEEKEEDKDELFGGDVPADSETVKEVFTIECPYCKKEFSVVGEYEEGEMEVETKNEDDKEKETGKEIDEDGEDTSDEGKFLKMFGTQVTPGAIKDGAE